MDLERDDVVRRDGLEVWSTAVFAIFVLSCVGVSILMSEAKIPLLQVIVALVLSGIYIWIGTAHKPHHPLPRFAIQFLIVTVILVVFVRAGAFGIVWLVLMPLVAQSVMELGRSGVAIVSILSVILFASSIVTLGGIAALPESLTGFLLALFFVILFSQVAVREQKARREIERLAMTLESANRSLAEAAAQAEELAAIRERNRIAREIHDTLGHSLTVVKIQLEAAEAMLERDAGLTQKSIETARRMTIDALGDLRRSVSTLREDRRPLEADLEALVSELETEQLNVDLSVKGMPRRLSPETALTLYRVAQEGLTNLLRHSNAANAQIRLSYEREDTIGLIVTDDGSGAESVEGGFGLTGIRERVKQAGGTVSIETRPGRGFTISVEVPA